mmetsp:Transcript_54446/g.121839  ORF Transcript_54446/g.121839 Transcript_54446/m.121839 type:complete len:279 (-) Transcript_54446:228-1064(-)
MTESRRSSPGTAFSSRLMSPTTGRLRSHRSAFESWSPSDAAKSVPSGSGSALSCSLPEQDLVGLRPLGPEPTSSCVRKLKMRSGCLPCRIPHGMPAQWAVRAAFTFVDMPPVPSDEPASRVSTFSSKAWLTTRIGSADGSTLGFAVYRKSTSVKRNTPAASSCTAVSAAKLSLSPKRTPSVLVVSFSLMMGTTPASKQAAMVSRISAQRCCSKKSRWLTSSCAILSPTVSKSSEYIRMMRLWPTPATARFIEGSVGFFFRPNSRHPIPTAPEETRTTL